MEFLLILLGVLLIAGFLTVTTAFRRELALWRWRRRARRPRLRLSPRLTTRL
jgi:hypothetical protein